MLTIDEGFPPEKVKAIIEAALLSADGPVPLERLVGLFKDGEIASDIKEKRQIIKLRLKSSTMNVRIEESNLPIWRVAIDFNQDKSCRLG